LRAGPNPAVIISKYEENGEKPSGCRILYRLMIVDTPLGYFTVTN